jgi:cephalosporin-C deacetylase-like acetyl esterase
MKTIAALFIGIIASTSIFATSGKDDIFKYDSSRPFDVKEASANEENGVVVQDIDYAANSAQRGRIKAYIVKPKANGKYAGLLFFHWLGEKKSDRTQFLEEATALAKHGTVSLLIQGQFPWTVEPADGQTDRQRVIDETIEVRRALDLLISQPNVDSKRIGFIGHDYGAMYGSLVASVEKRVKTYVIVAAIGSFSNWSLDFWLKAKPAEFKEAYRQAFKTLEPIDSISHAAPAPILFQFASTDKYIPKEAAERFYASAKQPKEIKWYETDHAMEVEAARQDREAWLVEKLKLK